MDKDWKYNFDANADFSEMSKKFGLHPKVAALLANRGIVADSDINIFLSGGLKYLHNPFLFRDMKKAADRIRQAIDSKEQILVYGDRDVDGITAVNIIVWTLKTLGANILWYVPADEGYRIHKDILSQYAETNVKLLITVDCGIAANEEIEYAKNLGMDVILTDHHEPINEGIPKGAYAIIDPKLSGTKYPFKNIAGCLTALKTAQAVVYTYDKEYNKKILLFAISDYGAVKGNFVELCNNLPIQKGTFNSFEELMKLINNSFRTYAFENLAACALLEKNILLKEKIIFCQSAKNEDLQSLMEAKIKMSLAQNKMKAFLNDNLDLCALGTIADSMPLIDENRIIVREGLKILEQNPHLRPGLGLLIEDTLKTRHSYNITAHSISWNVTPVLNSSGRMGRGILSAQLLMTRDTFQAQNLYNEIIKLNGERRALQFANIGQFKYLLKEQCNPETDKILIVTASNLEHGVTGIVAAQVVKEYQKPAFLLISDGYEAVGTVRSVEAFNIIEALDSVRDLLIKYGGHSQAAGFTIKHCKIDEFKQRMFEYADKNIADLAPKNSIAIEGILKVSDINANFYKQIEALAPFGMANSRPVFCMKGVSATEAYMFGSKNEHLKFKVSQKGSRNIQAIFWNKSRMLDLLRKGELLDIAFHLDQAEKSGEQFIQLSMIDIKMAY
ncbi:MAG: single-stranded-DNA-specific exonuclease RecJ [Endomicrobium sp.]|jgi:single-stranded-DNA-specific exonuclease|nr:single-stranded-DNA-specific exonuclease RecJ [Endomicrobium sp.]